MVFNRKTTRYIGRHKHPRGINLSQEADLVMNNVLKSSGFFRGPGTGPNDGFGTVNPSMANFINKWNTMNNKRKGRFRKYTGNYKKDLAKTTS